jgi:hypothetical protein
MQKIVVNRCFGGFGLSNIAVKRYRELKGKPVVFYRECNHNGVFERVDDDIRLYPEAMSEITAYTKDLGKKVTGNQIDDYYFSYYDIPRDDPDLVKVVEELGEEANGFCANLEIVEIPDGVRWVIDEYDGSESVEEQHRSW